MGTLQMSKAVKGGVSGVGGLDGEEGRGVLTMERGFECWVGD